MIQRKNENWFRMLFIWRGSVLPKVLPRLILLLILSISIVYFKGKLFEYKIPLNPAPFTLFGIALALFLGFRNNASYDRFWEARKIWGALLNDTRSLARQALTMSGYAEDSKEVSTFINYLIAFTYALKHQLRHTDASVDLTQRLDPVLAQQLDTAKYKPIMLMKAMGNWVQQAKEAGKIDTIVQSAFDDNLNKLSEIVGGCERIASTPIPYSYRVLLHRTVYIYCFLLPFGFVDSLGWMTPIIVTFIAYTFVALEAIADEIEEPFGTEPNDMALNGMCSMIENTLLEMAGKPIIDSPPVKGYTID
ncbi:bestrophin family protein [Mucilaginibacter jinjuensis]|uniref:Bestrophin family ion channel n=1 Tax=Mucilaginibacter jinjuensis TaxID=1176721 RepID=A0ABY7T557_9SPHI|nr:bestrophin family ion channel [Mucilaginibacter jinjuensis]WCT11600.1 bestrophin family ion channel [Mucilaginibacter jinjuensis]